MNREETIAYFKGKLEGLRLLKVELKIHRGRVEAEIKYAKEQLRGWVK